MNPVERRKLIDRYAAGTEEVAKSLEGFSPAWLEARPLPGKWSAKEVVHHLVDRESISGIRLRRLLAEEHLILEPEHGLRIDADHAHNHAAQIRRLGDALR